MKADEAIRRIEFIVDKTVSDWGNVMLEVAQTADTMIKDRVIKTGQNAEGQYYPGYSTKPMLTNLSKDVYDVKNGSNITNKARAEKYGSKKKRKELKWVTLQRGGKNIRLFELEGGYKEFRNIHGRRIDFVDFAFSGRMWADIQVVSGDDEHKIGRARISTLSEEQMKKLAGNTERKGEILDLSSDETYSLARKIEKRLTDMWRQQGFL